MKNIFSFLSFGKKKDAPAQTNADQSIVQPNDQGTTSAPVSPTESSYSEPESSAPANTETASSEAPTPDTPNPTSEPTPEVQPDANGVQPAPAETTEPEEEQTPPANPAL